MANIQWLNVTKSILLAALGGLLAISAVACEDDDSNTNTTLNRPSSFVQSGVGLAKGEPEYIFIADSSRDFVTVLDTSSVVKDIDYIWSPSFYFPIMIPVGPSPTALATTHDGRVVVVASSQLGAVQFLDTAKLQMVESQRDASQILAYKIVDDAGSIIQLISLGGCGERCDDFMAVASDMMVQFRLNYQVDTAGEVKNPELTISQIYPVGESPVHATFSSKTGQLWVAQNSGNEILRADIISGQVDYFDVGGSQQDIALTPDGDTLFVAHADARKVAVFSGAAGTSLTHVVNDSPYQPTDGGSDTSDLFMRDIPWRLNYTTDRALTITCYADDDEEVAEVKSFDEYLIVASLRGVTYYFVPDESVDDSSNRHYTMADSNLCLKRTTAKVNSPVDGSSWWIDSCSDDVRPGRCHPETGVVVYPGYRTIATDTTYEVIYEADITLGTGGLGRGQIDEQGHFWVDSTIFTPGSFLLRTKSDIWSGDRLVITSTPDNSPADCLTRYGKAGEYVKRSFTLIAKDENGHYETDPYIDPACFDLGKKGLTYEIQATDSFYVLGNKTGTTTNEPTRLGRIKAGMSFGPGGFTATKQGVGFTIKSGACANGSCKQGSSQSFSVQDYFSPMRGAYFSSSSSLPTIGTMPVEIQVGPLMAEVDGEYKYSPTLMMLYSGTGAQTSPGLMIIPTFDSAALLATTNYYFFD